MLIGMGPVTSGTCMIYQSGAITTERLKIEDEEDER